MEQDLNCAMYFCRYIIITKSRHEFDSMINVKIKDFLASGTVQ